MMNQTFSRASRVGCPVLFALLLSQASANAQIWTGQWTAASGTMPEAQGWIYHPFYEPQTPPMLIGGLLHQGLSTFGGVQYWHREDISTDWATERGMAFEIRLRMLQATPFLLGTPCQGSTQGTWGAGLQVELSDLIRRTVVLAISESGVRMANDYCRDPVNSTPLILLNTTLEMNTYRLTMSVHGIDLSINGALAGHLLLGSVPQYSNQANDWDFGDTSVGLQCESLIESVRWGTVCRADFDGSGALAINDIFVFLAVWFAGDSRADFNGTNGTSVADIFDFLAAWFAGCP